MLTVELTGFRDVEGTLWLLNYYPSDAGMLPGGGFDVDAWDNAKTCLSAVPGADTRAAFRQAYRRARIEAREHGGLDFLILPVYEPLRFSDLEPDALCTSAVILTDNGPAYKTATI